MCTYYTFLHIVHITLNIHTSTHTVYLHQNIIQYVLYIYCTFYIVVLYTVLFSIIGATESVYYICNLYYIYPVLYLYISLEHVICYTVKSGSSATALSAKPFNPPQFLSTNVMYKYQ